MAKKKSRRASSADSQPPATPQRDAEMQPAAPLPPPPVDVLQALGELSQLTCTLEFDPSA